MFQNIRLIVMLAVVALGGNGVASACVWELDNDLPMGPRLSFAFAKDTTRNTFLLFGGADASGATQNDTWLYDGSQWQQLNVNGPSPRRNMSMVYDPDRQVFVLFGGTSGGDYLSDTWEFDPVNIQWNLRFEFQPSERTDAALAYDAFRQKVVLFGGRNGGTYYNDTFEWDGNTWRNVTTNGPSPRDFASALYDPINEEVILFGGRDGTDHFDDMWAWDGVGWRRLNTNTGPSPRRGQRLIWHERCGVVMLFGGEDDAGFYDDLWFWLPSTEEWHPVSTFGVDPGARAYHEFAYDSSTETAILIGGFSTGNQAAAGFHRLVEGPPDVELSANKARFSDGDTMIIMLRRLNQSCKDVDVDLYVLMEAYGVFYFYPAFSLNPAPADRATFPGCFDSGMEDMLTLELDFGIKDDIPLSWHAGLLDPLTGQLQGTISSINTTLLAR